MNDGEAFEYIKNYFYELFVNKDLGTIDNYLVTNYYDDDIGETTDNHRKESKAYLLELFRKDPTINVCVKKVQVQDDVISAYLEWNSKKEDEIEVLRKGIAIFEIVDMKIRKRHTYIYYTNQSKLK